MKIALFVHCYFPNHFYGTETYTHDLARHYQAWGNEVTVVSAIFHGEPRASGLLTRYEHGGISVVAIDKNYLPHRRVKETYYQADMRGVLEQVLRDVRPDLVHVTHLINHTAALLEVCGNLGIPAHATFTDFFGFCLNNKLEGADGALCAGPSASRTNCVACYLKDAARNPSAAPWVRLARTPLAARAIGETVNLVRKAPGLRGGAVDGLIEDIARRPDVLASLYNRGYRSAVAPTRFLEAAYSANGITVPMHKLWFGVDIDRSAKPVRPPGHVPVIGFIGQIAPHKGTDLLIEAYGRLDAGAAELRIYGPKDQDPGYMLRLESLARGRPVRFLGTFPPADMAGILRDIDLLIIPSRWYENSPLVLLNALATHTPVLVSDVAGMTEFLTAGVNGDSFQRGNLEDLYTKLAAMLAAPGRLAALAAGTQFERGTQAMATETFSTYHHGAGTESQGIAAAPRAP
jgi:glycosyltransferase involved in cell wall biosynthesis